MLKQENRLLTLETALGPDKLQLISLQGDEHISQLFRFDLEMLSDDDSISPQDVVGKNVSVGIEMADQSVRFFNGFISSFVAGDEDEEGRRNYHATMVPWLWFLTQTANCRIFQKKEVPEILEQVFQDLGFDDFDTSWIKGDHKKWDYCVQYRESDFSFVSRLMEQEGIFYFFRHENGKHTMVLADQNGACMNCPEDEVDYPRDHGSRAVEDYITNWEHRYEFCPGKCTHTDYNFKAPSANLLSHTNTLVKLPGNDQFEIYEYPGAFSEKSDSEAEIRMRMEELEIGHNVVNASSFCKSFTAGGKFKVGQHRNESEQGKSYIITSVSHSANEPLGYETGQEENEPPYQNRFTCIPDQTTVRPVRTTAKPFVQGVQTAVVVGPDGEEIYTDEFGRVKVQFHWDREGQRDENSSCWIRVSQIHAGHSFGGIDIPRVGQEVIVSFLEGDPDRPIITGRVFHAENMPPFGLPDSKNISGYKSNSTKGGGGYNEFVMDDTKDNELIRLHAQYDMDETVENDLREHVLNDRTRDVTNNETITIGQNRTETIQEGDETVTVEKGNRTVNVVTKNDTLNVQAGEQTINVDKGNATINVGQGNRAVNVQNANYVLNAKQTVQITGQDKIVATGNNEVNIAGKVITISAKEKIVLGVGSSTITIDAKGVKTAGPKIMSTAVGQHDISGALIKIN